MRNIVLFENQIKEIGLKNYKIILEPSKNTALPQHLHLYTSIKIIIIQICSLFHQTICLKTQKFITLISKALTKITDNNISLFWHKA